MADETLHTASRRMVRFFNIDICKGGIIVEDTEVALRILEAQIDRARQQFDPSLLEAAKKFVQSFNSDLNNGGLVTVATQHALAILDRRVREETVRQTVED
jgi:hypothetical protein